MCLANGSSCLTGGGVGLLLAAVEGVLSELLRMGTMPADTPSAPGGLCRMSAIENSKSCEVIQWKLRTSE